MLARQYPIYISFFTAIGHKLPLDHLLVDFLRETRFHLGQLTPNTIRIVLSTAELNRQFNLALGINKIKYYSSFSLVDKKYNLKARPSSPSLIKGLTSFHKGMYSDIVIITGNVEPDPINKLAPKQFGSHGA